MASPENATEINGLLPETHLSLGPIRVLIVSSCFPPSGWGGAEVAAEGIANWMASHGHSVAVYTDSTQSATSQPTRWPGRRYSRAKRHLLHHADNHGKQGAARKAIWHLVDHAPHQGFGDFARIVEDFHPDLVMVHLAPGMGIGIFEYCAKHDLPMVFVVHDFWMTCLRSSMFSKGGMVCGKRELACRWSSAIRWGALSKVPRLGFWSPSHKIVEIIRKELGDVLANVLVERNVVDLSDFASAPGGHVGTELNFLYVGKLTAAKGIDFALSCLADLPRESAFSIDILGSGDLESQLKDRFLGDQRFRFHGAQPRESVRTFYARAAVLLVPSIWFENSPLVIYQAQAAGVPVIASDSGGIPELLADRDDSIVLPAGNRVDWIRQLTEIARDRTLQANLKKSAMRYAAAANDEIDARAGRVMNFCQSIIGALNGIDRR